MQISKRCGIETNRNSVFLRDMKTLTKGDIVKAVSDMTGFQRSKVVDSLELMISLIIESMAAGETVELRGFGSFRIFDSKRQFVRDPNTGERIELSSRRRVSFSPHSKLKNMVGVQRGKLKDPLKTGKKGIYEVIDELYSKLISDPKSLETVIQLSYTLMLVGEYDKAELQCKKALELDNRAVEAYQNLGIICWRKGEIYRAEENFKKAVNVNPDDSRGHYCLGLLFYKKGLYSKAISELQESIRLNPDIPDPYFYLGMCYNHYSMYGKALSLYKSFVERRPEDPRGYWYLGVMYDRKNMKEKASEMYSMAARISFGERNA